MKLDITNNNNNLIDKEIMVWKWLLYSLSNY